MKMPLVITWGNLGIVSGGLQKADEAWDGAVERLQVWWARPGVKF